MEDAPYDVLRAILLWLPRQDIFRLSRVSSEINQSAANAINPLTLQGNSWWMAKLAKDYDAKVVARLRNAHMPANEKYVALMPNLVDRLRYAVAVQSQGMMKYLTTKLSIAMYSNWNTKKSDIIITIEDLAVIMDLVPDAVIVRRLLARDMPMKGLIEMDREDLALHLLTLDPSDYALKQAANQLALEYKKHHAPEILEMYQRVVTHPNFLVAENNYEALEQAVRSGSSEVVAILLNTMKLVKGKRIGVDSSKGYPVRLAMEAGNAAVLEELIGAGADPQPTVGDNLFRDAMSRGRVDLARILSDSPLFGMTGVSESALLRSSPKMKKLVARLEREGKISIQ